MPHAWAAAWLLLLRRRMSATAQVDVHEHWLGPSMLLIVLAIAADRISIAEKWKFLLAWSLFVGSVLFPFGVLMETWSHGTLPRAVAIVGSAMVITSLAGMVLGFLRRQDAWSSYPSQLDIMVVTSVNAATAQSVGASQGCKSL